jgi:hypothetical protein
LRNEPILKIRKSLSINNKLQKSKFRIAKSTPKIKWAVGLTSAFWFFQSHSKAFKEIQSVSKVLENFFSSDLVTFVAWFLNPVWAT